jgi:hypothetical protein
VLQTVEFGKRSGIRTYVGAISAVDAFLYLAITLVQKLVFGIDAPGVRAIAARDPAALGDSR